MCRFQDRLAAFEAVDATVYGVAKRSVFVVEADGTISYAWVSDDPGLEPDYDEIEAAVDAGKGV